MSKQNIKDFLKNKARTLPQSSGCYLMKNSKENIIYVGKAKNLKSRVSSYFQNTSHSAKTQLLVSHIKNFDFILTHSENESLILENNLIKEHRPKYNIRMRDDKSYPYVRINNDEFPRLEYIRRPKKRKGDKIYGPYPVGTNFSHVLRTLIKIYQLRDCSKKEFNSRKEPCLLYQIKQCSAPCVGFISNDDYKKDLDKALKFLSGKKGSQKNINDLQNTMMTFSEKEEFEQAAILRDQINVLDLFITHHKGQDVENLSLRSVDLIDFYPSELEVDISIYQVRNSLLLGLKSFHFLKSDFTDNLSEDVYSLVSRYYVDREFERPELMMSRHENFKKIDELELGIKWKKLSKKFEKLAELTFQHAQNSCEVRMKSERSVYIGLKRLGDLLNLKERPKILECYDVAIWQGKSPTAAQIVFEEGVPDKSRYRHYGLKEREEGNNDFAMMREVISRRLKYGQLPDVFVIDGGKAQVSTVLKVLEEFNISLPVVGIAKEKILKGSKFYDKHVEKSDERLIIPGRANPFVLTKCPSLFKILVHMRDEAHRFSRRLHHKHEENRFFNKEKND